MGRDEHCAVAASGVLRCWEANRPETVHRVPIPEPVVQVDAAFSHTCAVTASRSLFCWGDNGSGQLGTPSPPGPAESASPLRVSGVGRVADVRAPGAIADFPRISHVGAHGAVTCALDLRGRVACLGGY